MYIHITVLVDSGSGTSCPRKDAFQKNSSHTLSKSVPLPIILASLLYPLQILSFYIIWFSILCFLMVSSSIFLVLSSPSSYKSLIIPMMFVSIPPPLSFAYNMLGRGWLMQIQQTNHDCQYIDTHSPLDASQSNLSNSRRKLHLLSEREGRWDEYTHLICHTVRGKSKNICEPPTLYSSLMGVTAFPWSSYNTVPFSALQ